MSEESNVTQADVLPEEESVKKGDVVTVRRHPDRNKKYSLLSGSTLKIIAIVTMFIDHVGAAILENYLSYLMDNGAAATRALVESRHPGAWAEWMGNFDMLYSIDRVLRATGRIAFPIFCFLLVEGFFYTKNVYKYGLRLLIFAVISDIPFDLAFFTEIGLNHQNVFLTLFFGLAAMFLMDRIKIKFAEKKVLSVILQILAAFACMVVAQLMHTDYGAIGVFAIVLLYIYRSKPIPQCIAGGVFFFLYEVYAAIAFIPIFMYNGKKGLKMKYFFYAFYPVHLFLLFLIRYWMIGF